ncbi:MAG: lipopolysaccharide heptosyltransferase I [Puniceicoccales bacterium]|jgi:heptosyltransferase-1|nr:lipopolysaccharide heptosyltransferase I [Puniceicoccales bacterium]
MSTVHQPSRILIIRLSALGDVVMASGLIPALKSRFPDAKISWLVESAAEPLLRHNPRLDEVIVWPRAQWRKLWRERRIRELWSQIRALFKKIRLCRYDLVLDAQGLLKSAVWARLSGAPRRVGLFGREGGRFLLTERVIPEPRDDAMMSSEYRFLAKYLGAGANAFDLDLAVGEVARQKAKAVLGKAGVAGGFAVLSPFTTRPQKHWFEERWIELARALIAKGIVPVILGGPGDREAAQRMTTEEPGVIDLTGLLKLDESVAVIAMSKLLIGVDTGLTHMSTALKIPTVALFGSTRPYLDAGSPLTKVLYEKLPCSPCRRRPTCGGTYDCMRALTVDQVLAQAQCQMGLVNT